MNNTGMNQTIVNTTNITIPSNNTAISNTTVINNGTVDNDNNGTFIDNETISGLDHLCVPLRQNDKKEAVAISVVLQIILPRGVNTQDMQADIRNDISKQGSISRDRLGVLVVLGSLGANQNATLTLHCLPDSTGNESSTADCVSTCMRTLNQQSFQEKHKLVFSSSSSNSSFNSTTTNTSSTSSSSSSGIFSGASFSEAAVRDCGDGRWEMPDGGCSSTDVHGKSSGMSFLRQGTGGVIGVVIATALALLLF
jgi:hypothetical protein